MGFFRNLFSNKGGGCTICQKKLFFAESENPGPVEGLEGFLAVSDQLNRLAYKCNNCGTKACRSCANDNACPECAGTTFDRIGI